MNVIGLIKKALKEKQIDERFADRVQKIFKVEKEDDVAGAVLLFSDNELPAIKEAEEAAKKVQRKKRKKHPIHPLHKKKAHGNKHYRWREVLQTIR